MQRAAILLTTARASRQPLLSVLARDQFGSVWSVDAIAYERLTAVVELESNLSNILQHLS